MIRIFGRQGRLRALYSAQFTFQSNVCYNSNRFGWIYYTRYCYSSLPNWSVCFVLRRLCFLLFDVIIYVIGICGYTKRSLIRSRFSLCIYIYHVHPDCIQIIYNKLVFFFAPKDAQNITLLKIWRHEWRCRYMFDIPNKSQLHYASNEV